MGPTVNHFPVVTMHQTVKETNDELKEKKPEVKTLTHKKSPSGSSTSSNLSVQLRRSSGPTSDVPQPPTGVHGYAESNKLSDTSSRKTTLQTPSPSVMLKSHLRSRPKSFAQKFRPNSRLAGMGVGYGNAESPGFLLVQILFSKFKCNKWPIL